MNKDEFKETFIQTLIQSGIISGAELYEYLNDSNFLIGIGYTELDALMEAFYAKVFDNKPIKKSKIVSNFEKKDE